MQDFEFNFLIYRLDRINRNHVYTVHCCFWFNKDCVKTDFCAHTVHFQFHFQSWNSAVTVKWIGLVARRIPLISILRMSPTKETKNFSSPFDSHLVRFIVSKLVYCVKNHDTLTNLRMKIIWGFAFIRQCNFPFIFIWLSPWSASYLVHLVWIV